MLAPFQYEFFLRGLIVAALVGGLCGMIGVYIVLRRMAYVGHGLSHAIFGGAVASYVMSINFFIGASIWGFASAMLINLAARKRNIGADAAIGIVTTSSFALGVALISRFKGFTRSFEAALFGNVLAVSESDLIAVIAVSLAALAVVVVGYKYLLFTTFEPEVAGFYGVPTAWVDAMFALTLAGVIVVSLQILGVTMIAAAIVIPPVRGPPHNRRLQPDDAPVDGDRGHVRFGRPVHKLVPGHLVRAVGRALFRGRLHGRADVQRHQEPGSLRQVAYGQGLRGDKRGVGSLSLSGWLTLTG